MSFHEARLANGLQIITEINPGVHSVGLSFFVKTGSRDETDEIAGVSHFLEHMAFKGNEQFQADDVNRIFDEVGAKYNAATGEEVTMFYAAVLPEYLERTMELLSALIRPSLRTTDFDLEKNVILEEIGMYDDMPGYVAYDKVMHRHFAGHPLGRSVLGTRETISPLAADQMRAYHAQRYTAGNIVLAVTGHTAWETVRGLAEKYCASWPAGNPGRTVTAPHLTGGRELIHRENGQQQYVMQLLAAPDGQHPLRNAAELLALMIGDDSGSRLYWDLIDPGYAESADLSYQEFNGTGVYRLSFSGEPEETEANLQRVQTIYEAVNTDGVAEAELQRARNKLLSRTVLYGERPMGRLESLGNHWLYRDRYVSVDEDLEAIRAVTVGDIRKVLDEFPLRQTTNVTVGPLESINWPV